MISSERAQNIIVSFVIITAVVSSVLLIGNANYYSGSYVLAGRLEVSIVGTVVSDLAPANDSIYPVLAFTINFRTDSPTEGNVQLTAIYATVWLNDDLLSYTPLSRDLSNDAKRLLHPAYNSNFTLATRLNSITDRASILQADSSDTWNWYLRLRYEFITFDEPRSLTRIYLSFNWTDSTTIIYY